MSGDEAAMDDVQAPSYDELSELWAAERAENARLREERDEARELWNDVGSSVREAIDRLLALANTEEATEHPQDAT